MVCLVGMVEKWEDRKYFNFSPFCLVGSGKVEGWKKWICINYSYIFVKKWWPIKTKKWQTTTKKKNHPIY